MNFRYIFLAMVVFLSGWLTSEPQSEPVLFVGQPCSCMESIRADCPQDSQELIRLLAEREYCWIVVFDPMENRQSLARHLIRTQPQAQIILMDQWSLAPKYQMACISDCKTVLEMLEKDRDAGWKSGF